MIIKDQKGYALPLILVIVLALTLLGIALFTYFMSETRQVSITEEKIKAHYLARTGAHAVASYMIENPEDILPLIDSDESNLVNHQNLDSGEFEGEIEIEVYGDFFNEIFVRSIGTVGNTSQTVIASVHNVWVNFPLFGLDLYKTGGGEGSGSVTGGDIVYVSSIEESVKQMLEEDREAVQMDRNFEDVQLPCKDEDSDFYGSCPDYPGADNDYDGENYDDGIIDVDRRYGLVESKQDQELVIEAENGGDLILKADKLKLHNRDMTVNLDDNNIAIVVDEFEGGNNDIIVNGKGYLMIYVKERFESDGNFELDYKAEEADDTIVNIFVLDGGEFDLGGTTTFEGAIYAPNADVYLGGNTKVLGWVIADKFKGKGDMEIRHIPIKLGDTSLELDFFELKTWRYDDFD